MADAAPRIGSPTWTLERIDEPDLKFTGELVASASTKKHYGDSQNRYSNFSLYKTRAGKFVCHRVYISLWQGEEGSSEALVCSTTEEVIAFFGHSEAAKELYHEADIDAEEVVD